MRQKRILKKGATYHVIARINRKEKIFNSDSIKGVFIGTVRKAQGKYSFYITNFCIMGNHIHFLIKPYEEESLSRIMQWILSVFAMRFNRIFNYSGHVWYDRFKSYVIYSYFQYLKTFIYISRNPVRAGITKWAVDYQYNGITFIQKGYYDILTRPPTEVLRVTWPMICRTE